MRHVSGIVLLALLFVGTASGIEVGVTVTQDRLYQPTLDTLIRPTAFLAGVEFGIGRNVGIEVRAGYSGYYSWTQRFDSNRLNRTWSHGARLQAVPRVHIVAPFGIDWLQLRAGIGLAGLYFSSGDRTSLYGWNEYGVLSEHVAWSGVQSLIGGLRFKPVHWFAIDFEVEHPGVEVSYTQKRTYQISHGYEWEDPELSDDVYTFSWLGDTKTAIGASLKFGL